MNVQQLVKEWFEKWETGEFLSLPISGNFKHTSPYGTIYGKKAYLELVSTNKEKFLGHRFLIHNSMFDKNSACVRYTAIQGDFQLEVCEWHFTSGHLIEKIIAYYNIKEPRISIDQDNFIK